MACDSVTCVSLTARIPGNTVRTDTRNAAHLAGTPGTPDVSAGQTTPNPFRTAPEPLPERRPSSAEPRASRNGRRPWPAAGAPHHYHQTGPPSAQPSSNATTTGAPGRCPVARPAAHQPPTSTTPATQPTTTQPRYGRSAHHTTAHAQAGKAHKPPQSPARDARAHAHTSRTQASPSHTTRTPCAPTRGTHPSKPGRLPPSKGSQTGDAPPEPGRPGRNAPKGWGMTPIAHIFFDRHVIASRAPYGFGRPRK